MVEQSNGVSEKEKLQVDGKKRLLWREIRSALAQFFMWTALVNIKDVSSITHLEWVILFMMMTHAVYNTAIEYTSNSYNAPADPQPEEVVTVEASNESLRAVSEGGTAGAVKAAVEMQSQDTENKPG